MKHTVTAKDVAKLAGVSQSSVSRVFFEGAKVSEKTRAKIMAAAEELGYRPNEFARSLITNRTKIIGIVMKGVHNPFYPQVLKQFAAAFKEKGYSMLFVHTNNDEIEAEDVETLLNYNVAGVIITDAVMALNVGEEFKKNKIPVVFFNRKLNSDEFYSVSCNNLDAGRKVAQYFFDQGIAEMAYIAGDADTSTSRDRQRGFQEVLKQKKAAYRHFSADYTYNGGYTTAMQMIEEGNTPPAIFVANDIMALGVLDALKKNSIQVPEQTKVIGFDNIEMASWPAYQLTTWEQPIDEMIEATLAYLLTEIAEYTGTAETFEVDGHLIERATT